MPADHEIFLDHLNKIFGEVGDIHVLRADDGGRDVSVFVYYGLPEPDMITGITYGLSFCDYPQWKLSRPELIVSLKSKLIQWPCAAAAFAAGFRGEKSFSYGDVFTTDVPLAKDTKMDGFLTFAQSIFSNEYQSLQLSEYKIHFSQLYPIYRSELPIYSRIGLEKFWKHKDFDIFNPQRAPITSDN